MYIVNYSTYKNDPDLDNQVMVVCGDRDPSHAWWVATKLFSSKEKMLDFVISYIKELELFSDFRSDEEYLELKTICFCTNGF